MSILKFGFYMRVSFTQSSLVIKATVHEKSILSYFDAGLFQALCGIVWHATHYILGLPLAP